MSRNAVYQSGPKLNPVKSYYKSFYTLSVPQRQVQQFRQIITRFHNNPLNRRYNSYVKTTSRTVSKWSYKSNNSKYDNIKEDPTWIYQITQGVHDVKAKSYDDNATLSPCINVDATLHELHMPFWEVGWGKKVLLIDGYDCNITITSDGPPLITLEYILFFSISSLFTPGENWTQQMHNVKAKSCQQQCNIMFHIARPGSLAKMCSDQ